MDKATPRPVRSEAPPAPSRRSGRSQARQRRTDESRGYRTPDWLDRSFVLPVQPSADSLRVPMPTQARPRHDDLEGRPTQSRSEPPPQKQGSRISGLVRPETPAVDYATLSRRNGTGRLARRTAIAAVIVAVVAAMLAVATGSVGVVIAATAAAVLAAGAGLVALALAHAPVPHLAPRDN